MADLTLFDLDAPAWVPIVADIDASVRFEGSVANQKEWTTFTARVRCRDCGVLIRTKISGGGCENGRPWFRCDECAELDHGILADLDAAHTRQTERRAAYLASQAVVA